MSTLVNCKACNKEMSPSAVYDQLISSAGDKFTPSEAQYAKDNLK
ncbi:Ltp family lipoprotein [Clostridium frigoriphilum]|uniref:Ltp family lipoprotein n=1 Tax=Clostridium frigoriphilum TaxID=443253 RepID=A0ABU7URD7_9CLOT|nr:Ltp family lipoprotein [Clostridium sp. DSM 17811]MBU3100832.1 Ltp family lipoprotein [Clostridium sp. DSM 17811]